METATRSNALAQDWSELARAERTFDFSPLVGIAEKTRGWPIFIVFLVIPYKWKPVVTETGPVMDATSPSRVNGSARAVIRDQIDLQESRLWDRARFNLMLLYGGRRGGITIPPASTAVGGSAPFGAVDVEI